MRIDRKGVALLLSSYFIVACGQQPPSVINPTELPGLDPVFRSASVACIPDAYLLNKGGNLQVFPPSDAIFSRIRDEHLPPFPGAPADIQGWLRENHPDDFDQLPALSSSVVDFDATKNYSLDKFDQLKAWCIFQIHRQGRGLTRENVQQVLAEYEVRYKYNPYISFMLNEHIPAFLPNVNRLLKVSGVEEQIPPDLKNRIVFKTKHIDVGGGQTWFDMPFVFMYGNYDSPDPNSIGAVRPDLKEADRDDIFRRTAFHEAKHDWIEGPNLEKRRQVGLPVLSGAEAEFAHTATGFITLPVEYWTAPTFEPWEAVDPRVQYVWTTLVNAGMDKKEAYTMIVKASATFDITPVIKAYNKSVPSGQETFEQLFAKEHPVDVMVDSGMTYTLSDGYLKDFDNLIITMTELSDYYQTSDR
ncbi:hypothetical protein A2627_03575 [Candidatus Woesebacteria bacterium RIFCSPHIGHO2_01_FULL_39_28]|uniref:DUF4932 domain-containing protein n=1 Tax=Candidatus Woesebacteria bacterium RIFCSPHIGHO2_01_FULL_39_28 TaxID=1802496 RepID=A0A1F7Y9W8_9BACT|nr:MAG: hypothetical protein A2627_03575 [Candidatus Woesebacteria bacterium RIFCSPHIGHO2_01_FULL_39_28]OGM57426.1 MAG: hypothetical protein A3A50_05850 [Candidatus Woesebacteria bacterium RIFCSPLOWO2_01_FULL_38_20]